MTQTQPKPHVLLVSGKDPEEDSGGHGAYVRVWGRALLAAGFSPEIFAVSHQQGVMERPFGRLHRVQSPFWRRGNQHRSGFRGYTIAWHGGLLTRAAAAHAQRLDPSRRVVVQGFHIWTVVGARVVRMLRAQGREATLFMSMFTTTSHEMKVRWQGVWRVPGWTPKISMAWEMINYHAFMKRSERAACRSADRILVNYESVRRLVTEAWAPRCPIERVPYTTESALIEDGGPVPLPNGMPLVLAVSRHDSRKGLDTLLRAFVVLKRNGVAFRARLIGGGSLLPVHRRLAAELELNDLVEITGYVEDTRPHWEAASVFVLPSHEEGSGSLSLLEALQRGRAVVASNIDGIPEDVEDGRSGLLVPPKKPEALAAALRRVIEDGALRRSLARGARERFEQQFAPSFLVKAVADLYGAPPTSPQAAAPLAAGCG